MRIRLSVLIILLAGCGGRGDGTEPEAVLATLDARAGVLSPVVKFHWMETGLEPLREGLAAIQNGTTVHPLGEAEAERICLAADVILVADLHDLDPCRRAFAHAVRTLAPPSARSAGRVALALECIPLTMEASAREARAQPHTANSDPFADTLRAVWPWPILQTAALLREKDLAACPLLAAGRSSKGVNPPAHSPDSERQPGIDLSGGMSIEDWKYGADFGRGNENALSRVGFWLREASQRRAFVLYGAAHLLGEGNLAERFRSQGSKVVVLVPFLPEWEAALRRRFGDPASRTWYEVTPGVLRPPFVGDEEVVEIGVPAPAPAPAPTLQIPQRSD